MQYPLYQLPENPDLYKYPLYPVRKIVDFRDMLNQSIDLYGERTAFLTKPVKGEPYHRVTYKQYNADVRSVGTALLNLDMKTDKRVAILSETRYEWYVTYLGAGIGEAILVPLDRQLPLEELYNCLMRCEVNALCYSEQYSDVVSQLVNRVPYLELLVCFSDSADVEHVTPDWVPENMRWLTYNCLREQGRELYQRGDNYIDTHPIDPETLKVLLVTSGTTSTPKVVMLNQRNICINLIAMCSMCYIDEYDTFLSILPLNHTYECTCGFLCQMYRGSSIAQTESLRAMPKNMVESKVTIMLCVPLVLEAIYRRIWKAIDSSPALKRKVNFALKISKFLLKIGIDIRRKLFKKIIDQFGGNLRLLISGGAAADPVVVQGFKDFGINCIQGYGLTECAPILALNRSKHNRPYSAGLPMPGVDVKIKDPDENGIGEVLGKGDNVMMGYYNDPELTAEAIRDGYYHTGDLGYLDDEGFLVITGRLKNVIITANGKNVFPEEIETLLCREPLIQEAMVYGAEKDKDVILVASLYLDQEEVEKTLNERGLQNTHENIVALADEAVRRVNAKLVPYKHIRNFSLREKEFVKTTTRKIQRHFNISEAETENLEEV